MLGGAQVEVPWWLVCQGSVFCRLEQEASSLSREPVCLGRYCVGHRRHHLAGTFWSHEPAEAAQLATLASRETQCVPRTSGLV